MNAYTQLLYYIKSLGEADVFINTVAKDAEDKMDLYKGIIYPLLDIVVGDTATFPSTSLVQYSVTLYCLAQRDSNNELVDDKFWKNDNESDNLNETMASLSRIWVSMNRGFEDSDIIASDTPVINKITGAYNNTLDGWSMEFTVTMPMMVNLCQDGC